jgi:hypothetical protein
VDVRIVYGSGRRGGVMCSISGARCVVGVVGPGGLGFLFIHLYRFAHLSAGSDGCLTIGFDVIQPVDVV